MRVYIWQTTTQAHSWPLIQSSSGREQCGTASPTNETLRPLGARRFLTLVAPHILLGESEDQPEQLSLQRVDLVPPGEADVVVHVEWSGISTGTELPTLKPTDTDRT